MAGDETSLGGTIRGEARGAVGPVLREGRVSRMEDGRMLVQVRSLMGDARPVPAQGWAPRPTAGAPLEPTRGDAVWVATDEGGALVVVAWEPR